MKVKTDTIIRTIVLAIALINQVLAIYGREAIPITEDNVYQLVTLLVTIGAAVWSWWKNNSFTYAALKGDEVEDAIKEQFKERIKEGK